MSTVSRARPTATTRAERVSLLSPDSHRTLLAERTSETRRHAYSAYGHRRSASVASRYGFNGEYQEPGGCYLLGSYRAYNPVLMRLHSPDSLSPFGAGGLNAYAYCLGDPVNRVDPTGHLPKWAWPAAGIALSLVGLGFAVAGALAVVPATGKLAMAAYAASTSTGLAGAAAGVGSAVLQARDPDSELGNILGYVSLGLGVASMAFGIGGLALEAKRVARQKALEKATARAIARDQANNWRANEGMRSLGEVPMIDYSAYQPSTYGHGLPGYRPGGGSPAYTSGGANVPSGAPPVSQKTKMPKTVEKIRNVFKPWTSSPRGNQPPGFLR